MQRVFKTKAIGNFEFSREISSSRDIVLIGILPVVPSKDIIFRYVSIIMRGVDI